MFDVPPQVVVPAPAPRERVNGPVASLEVVIAPTVPKAPAPIVGDAAPSVGLSVLNMPPVAPAQPAVAVGAAAAPAPAVQPVMSLEDHDWITLPWTVVMEKNWTRPFEAAHSSADTRRVPDCVPSRGGRSRRNCCPNGQWGRDVVIRSIPHGDSRRSDAAGDCARLTRTKRLIATGRAGRGTPLNA